MKRALIVGSVATVAIVLAGALGASAMGGGWMRNASPEDIAAQTTERFEHQAELLGMSVSDVKAAWAKGTTMQELAEERGISDEQLRERMQAERQERMQEHMSALVKAGVITQAQADEHIKTMAKREPGQGNGRGNGEGRGQGMHRGMGFGF